MGLRRLTPLVFRPRTLSDTRDGTNSGPGSMLVLKDLLPDPATPNVFICRTAAQQLTGFSGFTSPGKVTMFRVIGTRAYGFVTSQRFPGRDEPFVYDIQANQFLTLTGVNANNLPLTRPATGDWIPPTISAVTNARVIFTHPGFTLSGPYLAAFGWLDISSFQLNSLLGNTTIGSNIIASINDGYTSAPIADGVQPGQSITGPGIPANTTVLSCSNGVFSLTTTGTFNGTSTITGVANLAGVLTGMGVSGPLIAPATTVLSISGTTVTLSQPALGSGTAQTLVFSGGGTITLSANATATASQVALSISGGSLATPQWGAGNCNTYPLARVPAAVGAYNGRAWYAVGNAVVFSDTLNPTQVTNASQALIIGDNTPVTALAGQPFISTTTGGIIQALIVFKGAENLLQITGDAATENLTLNTIAGSVGTLAPDTICETTKGLAFITPDGLRFLGQDGTQSEPQGAYGQGVSVPFINALYPSRMCAAFNQNAYRVSVQNGMVPGSPWQEYVYDFKLDIWTGPHSLPSSAIDSYTDNADIGFICAPQSITASLWFHSLVPVDTSSYTENGTALTWAWQTSLLPDNQKLTMNTMLSTNIALLLPAGGQAQATFYDEASAVLNSCVVASVTPFTPATWGHATWGQFVWGGGQGYFREYRVPWTDSITFKQGSVQFTGTSAAAFAIGNLYLGYQMQGNAYPLEDLPAITGFTAITATALSDGSFTAITGTVLPDGSYTGILAGFVEAQSGYP